MIRATLLVLAAAAGILSMPLTPVATAEVVPYRNCTEARQNGDCDIPATSDKYQSKLDRDNDGLGCEC
ncbi:excalibur calcium-binding domain-containing protein [Mycolicibacter heraklionensis]|uniref:excalibur calcium-binding domain-containing protein n=1 Tax=Mycolicibacter heraklionensis TaxID=512402 RepID=UPI0009EE8D48|nr:excalibur calcium-binding domain-containing protein [Mycolicibacter heraklionensis]